MKKYIIIGVLVFTLLTATAITIHVNVQYKKSIAQEEQENNNEYQEEKINVDFDALKQELLALSSWETITENDKITFAFGSSTEVIERVVKSLENNQYVICYTVGGRLDKENKGSYFIMTGFDDKGKVKVLSPQNNYKEKSYIFERIFENVEKILFFDGTNS